MSLFLFNNQQKLIKSIPNRDLISVVQDQAINVSDTLFVELPADIWSNLKEPASYLAVQDPYERFSYHMYKVSKQTTKADTVEVEAIQIGYDELKAYGYIKDRRFNNRPVLEAATAIVDGTDWQLGYIDTNLPNVNTNFYYISRLEALSKLIEATGAEVRFRVEISGNKIIAKRMDLYKKLGTFKGKRFAYGSNLLEIVKEEDTSELYTALVGRGKGEETDTGGFGRRITFADVSWSKASGDPVDKPLGQEFIELPEMTAYYGYPDGEPRTDIVEFGDIEEPELLLKATYERLVEISRPQVQFKAKVQTTGDMQLGEEVAIIRSDLGFRYKTRVFRVKRDYLNNMYTEVELGDKLTESFASRIKKIDTTNAKREETIIQYIQTAANGKNKIFRGPVEPTEGMMVNDLWYKPVGEGETMLYTWNGEIWELSKVSAGLLAGTLDAENGDVNLINVNVANIVGETSSFVQSNWNNISTQITIDNRGINITGSDQWRRTYFRDIGFDFFNGSSADNKAGAMGYFKSNLDLAYPNENVVSTGEGKFHLLGIAANRFHEVVLGYNPYASTNRVFQPAIRVRGENGDVHFHTRFSNGGTSGNYLSLDASPVKGRIGMTIRNDNSKLNRLHFGDFSLHMEATSNIDFWTESKNTMTLRDVIHARTNIQMNGNDVVGNSDERLKKNIVDSNLKALDHIDTYNFVEFEWKDENRPEGKHFGLIAQNTPFISEVDNDDVWNINLSKQTMLTTKGVQELHQELKETKQELADLKALLKEKGVI